LSQLKFVFEFQDRAQRVFTRENHLLASLEEKEARRLQRVWAQAWACRLWTPVPMLPTRIPAWRSADRSSRQDLQNTYQLAALAFDIGVPRIRLAHLRSFREFELAAKESARFFDLRIGPPWWSQDRDYLEMAYTAAMEQEKEDPEILAEVACYLGDDISPMPSWMAQSWLDNEHARSADIMSQAWHHYYKDGVLRPDKDADEAKATLLLNWQVMEQPRLSLWVDEEDDTYTYEGTFPHRNELRRLIRLLGSQPRGRPQRRALCLS